VIIYKLVSLRFLEGLWQWLVCYVHVMRDLDHYMKYTIFPVVSVLLGLCSFYYTASFFFNILTSVAMVKIGPGTLLS